MLSFFRQAFSLLVFLFPGTSAYADAPDLNFLSPPPGLELQLTEVARYSRDQIPDLSTGLAQPHVALVPSDLEFFPDGSGQALLLTSTGTVAWLGADLSILGMFQVASANSLANFQRTGEFWDNEGVLGLAFDPDFLNNGYFYLQLNAEPAQGVEVWRLTWDPSDLDGTWQRRVLVLSVPKPQIAAGPEYLHNHNGGNPSFGPDGQLYVLIGDGGIGIASVDEAAGTLSYQQHRSRDLTSLWGKVLRLDPQGLRPPEILAMGLRNPFTHAWLGDLLFIGDVGWRFAHDWEEINRLNIAHPEISDFAWPLVSGPCADYPAETDCNGLTDPVHGYAKGDSRFIAEDPFGNPPPPGSVNRSSVMLGPVYQEGAYRGYLDHVLLYADLLQGWIRGALVSDDGRILADRHLLHHHEPILNFTVGPDGAVYVLTGWGASCAIYRIDGPTFAGGEPPAQSSVPLIEDPEGALPRKLSDTGVFRDLASRQLADRVWTFEPQFPLWTDGAAKERFAVLPVGTQIDTRDPNQWRFPVGSLIFKHFSFPEGALRNDVETRVLQKLESGWQVGVYVWRPDGSDADLSDGRPIEIRVPSGEAGGGEIPYSIPGHAQCLSCHASAADFVVGLEALQLNHAVSGTHQLDVLAQQGLISHVPREPWPSIAGANPTEQQARGYLHGNCAHCHSLSGGLGGLGFSLQHLATRSVVGKTSARTGLTLVAPGDPGGSALLGLMRGNAGLGRMPPLATVLPDPQGLQKVETWIASLAAHQVERQSEGLLNIVEFYNPDIHHYFMTIDGRGEAARIDAGEKGAAWRRTGYHFKAWDRSLPPADTSPVCRFYGTPGIGPNSHFYALSSRECDRVDASDPGWTLETREGFYVVKPDGGGCPAGYDPVYRLYNRGHPENDANHRYTADLSVYQAMAAAGWAAEGVAMCAPR